MEEIGLRDIEDYALLCLNSKTRKRSPPKLRHHPRINGSLWRNLAAILRPVVGAEMRHPGLVEIKVAGKGMVEGVVKPRQEDDMGFWPFEVGGVMPAGDDVAFGIGGLAVEGQGGMAVPLA